MLFFFCLDLLKNLPLGQSYHKNERKYNVIMMIMRERMEFILLSEQ